MQDIWRPESYIKFYEYLTALQGYEPAHAPGPLLPIARSSEGKERKLLIKTVKDIKTRTKETF